MLSKSFQDPTLNTYKKAQSIYNDVGQITFNVDTHS